MSTSYIWLLQLLMSYIVWRYEICLEVHNESDVLFSEKLLKYVSASGQ